MPCEDVVLALIEAGRSGEASIPIQLANERESWQILKGGQSWVSIGEELEECDLRGYIKGWTFYGTLRPSGGSVSPGIRLMRAFSKRFSAAEPALTSWVVDHTANPYEPFGSQQFNTARSELEYSMIAFGDAVERRERRGEEEARDKVRRIARATRVAESYEKRILDAVRRKDSVALEWIVEEGLRLIQEWLSSDCFERAVVFTRSLQRLALEVGHEREAEALGNGLLSVGVACYRPFPSATKSPD